MTLIATKESIQYLNLLKENLKLKKQNEEMLEMLRKIVEIKEVGLDFTLDSIKQLIKQI